MQTDFQIVTTPKADTPGTSTILTFADKRYLFGHVGEGTQRAMVDTGLKMIKLKDVFLTGPITTKSTGGLIGMILTLSDVNSSRKEQQDLVKASKAAKRSSTGNEITASSSPATNKVEERPAFSIHGGKNLMNAIAATRTFVYRSDTSLGVNEIDASEVDSSKVFFEDGNIKVYALECTPASGGDLQKSPRKRSYDEISQAQNFDLQAEATKKKAILKRVVRDMFTTKKGALEVKADDSDYEEALSARLARDAELALLRLNSGSDKSDEDIGADEEVSLEGGPEKKVKISPAEESEKAVPSFPANRPLRRPWPATRVDRLPKTTPSRTSISYMIQLYPVRGKFLKEKAIALGVKPGPDFRKLTMGESVRTEAGNVVQKSDCVEPDIQYPGIGVIDIPDSTYIDGTLREVSKWLKNENLPVGLWMWILDSDIEVNELVQDFMKNTTGHHVVSSPSACPNGIAFEGSAAQLTRLNALNSENFQLPQCSNTASISGKSVSDPSESTLPFRLAVPLLNYAVRPKQAFEENSQRVSFDFEAVKEEIKTLGDGAYLQLAKEAASAVEKMAQDAEATTEKAIPGGDIEIWTLGTGSALPSKYRNVSSIFVRVPEVGNLLLDCGENSLGQLRRCVGDIDSLLRDLKCIYISHLHADHHLGAAAVLKQWTEATAGDPAARIHVIGPGKFQAWLVEYSDIEYIGLDKIDFIPASSLIYSRKGKVPTVNAKKELDSLLSVLRLQEVNTAYADHCQSSFTVAFTFKDPEGFKIAYSGDTRPTKKFVEIGRNSTVLIHEATFDDELQAEAVQKKHSTTSQAIKAGLDMQADFLLLTHFSQRYPKLPVIEVDGQIEKSSGEGATVVDPMMEREIHETTSTKPCDPVKAETLSSDKSGTGTADAAKQFEGSHIALGPGQSKMKIGFAFDLLRIKVAQIGRLQKFIPALRELFKDETENDAEGQDIQQRQQKPQKQQQEKQQNQQPKQKQKGQKQVNGTDSASNEPPKKSKKQMKREAKEKAGKEISQATSVDANLEMS